MGDAGGGAWLTHAEGGLLLRLGPAELVLCCRVCRRWRDALLDLGLCYGTVLLCARLADLSREALGEAVARVQELALRSLGAGGVQGDGALRGWAWDVLRFINRPEVLKLSEPDWDVGFGVPTSGGVGGHGPRAGAPFEVWLQLASQEPEGSLLSQGAARFSASGAFAHGLRRLRQLNRPPHAHACLYTLPRSGVRCVAVSPDGRLVASGGEHCNVQVWEALTGREVGGGAGGFEGHSDYVRCAAFSPCGKLLASGSEDASVILWDLATGERAMPPLEAHSADVLTLAFSPDGATLATAGADEKVLLWDLARAPPEPRAGMALSDYVRAVAFAPDGGLVATGCDDGAVMLWSAESGEEVRGPLWGAHGRANRAAVKSVAFSPCGRLVAGGGDDARVHVWDVGTGAMAAALEGHAEEVLGVCFTPDGGLLSASVDGTVRAWGLGGVWGWGERFRLTGHATEVLGVAVTPDGRLAVTASGDGTVKMWDAACAGGGCGAELFGSGKCVWSFALSPCGGYAACADQRGTRVWALGERGRELPRLTGEPGSWEGAAPEIRALGELVEEEVFLGDETDLYEVDGGLGGSGVVSVRRKGAGAAEALFVAPEWVNSVALSVRPPLIFAACDGGQVVILEAPFLDY